MLKLEVRSPYTRQFYGDAFVSVMHIDYGINELAFIAQYNGKAPTLYIQRGFSDTEFRLHEIKTSYKERK